LDIADIRLQIAQVKEKIANEKGWEASTQKLIYSGKHVRPVVPHAFSQIAGKILADSNTVESYKIEEKGFIVCMISKVCSDTVEALRSITSDSYKAKGCSGTKASCSSARHTSTINLYSCTSSCSST